MPARFLLRRLGDALTSTYWFVPALLVLAGLAVAIGATELDVSVDGLGPVSGAWWLYHGDSQGARSVLSTIATAFMTVAGVSFSITVAALSLTSQQYGPRLLRNFLRDAANQSALGVMVGTFVYCLLVLSVVSDAFVPRIAVTGGGVLAVASIAMLTYFIHHVTRSIQASRVISATGDELDRAIADVYPERIGSGGSRREPLPGRPTADAIPARRHGYVTAVDAGRLQRAAVAADVTVEIAARPGTYCERGAALAYVWPPERAARDTADRLQAAFSLGPERSTLQDVAFGVQQLTEIAVRALSPGVNNPYTAIMCAERLGTSFALFAQRRIPSALRYDERGALRVIAPPLGLPQLLHEAVGPIRRYGAGSLVVVGALSRMLATVARHARRSEDFAAIAAELDALQRAALGELALDGDRAEALGACAAVREALAAAEAASASGEKSPE